MNVIRNSLTPDWQCIGSCWVNTRWSALDNQDIQMSPVLTNSIRTTVMPRELELTDVIRTDPNTTVYFNESDVLRRDAEINPRRATPYTESLVSCERCATIFYRRNIMERAGLKVCPNCYHQSIWGYCDKPRPVFHGKTANKLYYGIEVELEFSDDIDLEDLVWEWDQQYLYYKPDSSIYYGLEVISHPASWNELIGGSAEEKWRKVLSHPDILGKTHQTCGMHVHMSLEAFTSLHLYKFMKFIYENYHFILAISQRRKAAFDRWAGVSNPDDKSIIYKAKFKHGYERHVAVALTPKTAEIRIFRGVTNMLDFTKNIEFCESLFQFTNTASVGGVTTVQYLKYLKTHGRRYPYLAMFIDGLPKTAFVKGKC